MELHNVTRFTDIDILTAYLQVHIAAEFELDDMDIRTPNSQTSKRLTTNSENGGVP